MEEKKANGKKIAFVVIGSIIAASVIAVAVITLFYQSYDPSKYGRNNGGVDPNNTGVPQTEIIEE